MTRVKKGSKIKRFEDCKYDQILESLYILRNLKKTTLLPRSILAIKKLMFLILLQKHLTNVSVALLTRFNKP